MVGLVSYKSNCSATAQAAPLYTLPQLEMTE